MKKHCSSRQHALMGCLLWIFIRRANQKPVWFLKPRPLKIGLKTTTGEHVLRDSTAHASALLVVL
jgi:hypothetical protein